MQYTIIKRVEGLQWIWTIPSHGHFEYLFNTSLGRCIPKRLWPSEIIDRSLKSIHKYRTAVHLLPLIPQVNRLDFQMHSVSSRLNQSILFAQWTTRKKIRPKDWLPSHFWCLLCSDWNGFNVFSSLAGWLCPFGTIIDFAHSHGKADKSDGHSQQIELIQLDYFSLIFYCVRFNEYSINGCCFCIQLIGRRRGSVGIINYFIIISLGRIVFTFVHWVFNDTLGACYNINTFFALLMQINCDSWLNNNEKRNLPATKWILLTTGKLLSLRRLQKYSTASLAYECASYNKWNILYYYILEPLLIKVALDSTGY